MNEQCLHRMATEGGTRYMLMHEVAELAVKKGGTVFGGFLRDFIFHEHMTKKFHEEGNDNKEYLNPEVSPDTFYGRTLIPTDIDIHFKTVEEFSEFKKMLREMSFDLFEKRRRFGYSRICFTLHLRLALNIYGVQGTFARRVLNNHVKDLDRIVPGSTFSVDVVVDNTSFPPFADNLDFMCNGLIMDSNGINLCNQLSSELSAIGKFRLLHNIMDDIVKKKAYIENFTCHRWKKMDEKGTWEILGNKQLVNKVFQNENCIICYEGGANYKLTCCNAFYHFDCLKKTLERDCSSCAHCRQDMLMDDEHKKLFEIR